MRHIQKRLEEEKNRSIDKNKLDIYPKMSHAISNVSLHNKLDGSQYVGWLLNKAGGNKKNVLYFEDCYGGHWKLQKLKT